MARVACAVSLLLVHLAVTGAASNTTCLGLRIWEVLCGPRLGLPRPVARTAMFLCGTAEDNNLNRNLLRSTGTTNVRLTGVQERPGGWIPWLKKTAKLYPDHQVNYVLDLSCPGALQVLKVANATKLFRNPYRWLLISSSNETSLSLDQCVNKAESVVEKLALFLDSEMLFMCRYGEKAQSALVIEWYHLEMNGESFYGELASWQPQIDDGRIHWTERGFKSLAVRRMNFRRNPIKLGYLYRYNETLIHKDDGYDTKQDTMTKYYWPILHNTADMLNATTKITWTQSWGQPDENGTWGGLAGMVVRGDVDISGLPMLHDHHRDKIFGYVNFRGPSAGVFIFRAPPMSYEANLFALPFPDSLWAAAGGLIATCVLLLYLVLRTEDVLDRDELLRLSSAGQPIAVAFEPVITKPILAPDPGPLSAEEDLENIVPILADSAMVAGDGIQAKARLHGSWSDVMLLVFGAICQQGSPVEARTVPGRIVTISLLIGIMFLFTSYSASIVVLLQSTSNSIRSLDDLWKSRLPCGAEDFPYIKFLFKMGEGEARAGILKKVLKKNSHNPSGTNFMTLEAGMERTRSEFFAFHALKTSIYPIISATWQEHEKCALREISNMVYPQIPDISSRKGGPILEVLRITLRRMHERGIRRREIGRLIPGRPVCTNPGSNFGSVSVMDCYFAMVILTTGMVASLVVLGLEHLASKKLAMLTAEAAAAAARLRSQVAPRDKK